jgi:hypothetical protein
LTTSDLAAQTKAMSKHVVDCHAVGIKDAARSFISSKCLVMGLPDSSTRLFG